MLKTKEAAQKRFKQSKLTPEEEAIINQRSKCVEDMADRIEAEMPKEEQFGPACGLFGLILTEAFLGVGQYQRADLLKEAAILNKKSQSA